MAGPGNSDSSCSGPRGGNELPGGPQTAIVPAAAVSARHGEPGPGSPS